MLLLDCQLPEKCEKSATQKLVKILPPSTVHIVYYSKAMLTAPSGLRSVPTSGNDVLLFVFSIVFNVH